MPVQMASAFPPLEPHVVVSSTQRTAGGCPGASPPLGHQRHEHGHGHTCQHMDMDVLCNCVDMANHHYMKHHRPPVGSGSGCHCCHHPHPLALRHHRLGWASFPPQSLATLANHRQLILANSQHHRRCHHHKGQPAASHWQRVSSSCDRRQPLRSTTRGASTDMHHRIILIVGRPVGQLVVWPIGSTGLVSRSVDRPVGRSAGRSQAVFDQSASRSTRVDRSFGRSARSGRMSGRTPIP